MIYMNLNDLSGFWPCPVPAAKLQVRLAASLFAVEASAWRPGWVLWRCVGSEHQPHESHFELTNSCFLWNLPWRIKITPHCSLWKMLKQQLLVCRCLQLLQPGVSLAFCFGAGVDGASALAASSSPEDRLGRCFGLQPTFNIFNGSVGAIP
jgi:hypothetical protein